MLENMTWWLGMGCYGVRGEGADTNSHEFFDKYILHSSSMPTHPSLSSAYADVLVAL